MADALLQDPQNVVGVVDTTGHFDVLKLYAFLSTRVRDDTELLKHLVDETNGEEQSHEAVTAKMLDRVKIMRAFDLVGVMEAVGEVSDELESRRLPSREDIPTEKDQCVEEAVPVEVVDEEPHKKTTEQGTSKQELSKRTFVADSDDEDELLFDDEPAEPIPTTVTTTETVSAGEEDELLFVDGADDRIAVSSPPWKSPLQSAAQTPIDVQAGLHSSHKRMKFLLIDNLAHIVSPLLRKDYTQGIHLPCMLLMCQHN